MRENVEVEFYQRENGKIPVREFLFSIPAKLRAKARGYMEDYTRSNQYE